MKFRRHVEAALLAKYYRINAVAQLLAEKVDNWDVFLNGTDLEMHINKPRKVIKAELARYRTSARKLVMGFSTFLFANCTERTFFKMFEEIKKGMPLGLRMPMREFETRFCNFRREPKKGRDQGRPYHSTISITLMGLRYEFPEYHIGKDIKTAWLEADYIEAEHGISELMTDISKKTKVKSLENHVWRQKSLHRWCIISCFSLIEAYLSGHAWRYQQEEAEQLSKLPAKDKKAIDDSGCTFRDRLTRIPRIVTGRVLWEESDRDVDAILEVKHVRDALMHPSPFSQPEKYGGRDKLAMIYNLDHAEVEKCLSNTVSALLRIFHHIYGADAPLPEWLDELSKLPRST